MWENKSHHSEWIDHDKRWAEGATKALVLFVSRLYRLCDLLADEPIEVSFGPQDGIPMTYTEMTRLIANKLTNLQPFTACVKVVTEKGRVEHTIRTLISERGVGRKEREHRMQFILANNLEKGYLRNRQAVEQEILARQKLPASISESDYPLRWEY